MKRITQEHGPTIAAEGERMMKRPNPVYMIPVTEDTEVETNEGVLTAHPGGYIAHDPISGHVWPVAASYVAQHYDPAPEVE